MKIAVISDIHSNIYELNEVLTDIENRNVDIIVCTGDLVGYGTRPNEVIEKIKKEKILTIMGNYDDAIGNLKIVCGCDYPDPKDAQKAALSMQFTSQETSDENKEFLSIEDFWKRGKVSAALTDKMRLMGVFTGMDESSQLSLF